MIAPSDSLTSYELVQDAAHHRCARAAGIDSMRVAPSPNYSAAATFWPSGLPSPVHASQPGDAAKLPLSPCVMSLQALFAPYSFGLMKPTGCPFAALMRAMSAAHSGATALVPPTTVFVPPISTS